MNFPYDGYVNFAYVISPNFRLKSRLWVFPVKKWFTYSFLYVKMYVVGDGIYQKVPDFSRRDTIFFGRNPAFFGFPV